MPSGPRRIPRSVRATPVTPPIISSFANEPCGQRYAPLGATPSAPTIEQPAPPKHFPFPNTPVDDELFHEFMLCSYTLVTCGMQFVHMYRTVWWLPHSYTKFAVNFYLINPYLVWFIAIILSRRLVYMLGCRFLEILVPEKIFEKACYFFRLILFLVIFVILTFCACKVLPSYSKDRIFYLCYPFLVYMGIFRFRIHPFFEFVQWSPIAKTPVHACSSKPEEIRNEVDGLIKNFNSRLKEIIFNGILNAYYAGFIPTMFALPVLSFDFGITAQHTLFILETSIVSFSVHFLSLRYCDILHRSALHLGSWEKIETGRSILMVNNTWKEDVLWPYGALVKLGANIWRAQGDCNASDPENLGQMRFYYVFKNPTVKLKYELLIHALFIVNQLVMLLFCSIWHSTLSVTFALFFNYYLLYKLSRDYMISSRIYREEREMHKKINMR